MAMSRRPTLRNDWCSRRHRRVPRLIGMIELSKSTRRASSLRRCQIECRHPRDDFYDLKEVITVGPRMASVNRELTSVAVNSSALARVESGVISQTGVWATDLVNVEFGVGLRAPEDSDGTLIQHRRDSEHTNRPRPHHDL
jgi:hypothetical protein